MVFIKDLARTFHRCRYTKASRAAAETPTGSPSCLDRAPQLRLSGEDWVQEGTSACSVAAALTPKRVPSLTQHSSEMSSGLKR